MISEGGARPRSTGSPLATLGPQDFGRVGMDRARLYTIQSASGMSLSVTDLGATVTRLLIPDRAGRLADVVLGCDSAAQYLAQNAYFGATVGRVANRIYESRFELSGKKYPLYPSDPPHHLHGGKSGWDRALWTAHVAGNNGNALRFRYVSRDKEEGYPGTVRASISYSLSDRQELQIQMTATTDALTLLNMVHHGYWNLAGHDSGSILEHELTLYADAYTPGAPVPRGAVVPVQGTPFDFTTPKPIGRDLPPTGYDHNFVVNGRADRLRPVAFLKDPVSGRTLSIAADQPGVQFYSGNFLDGSIRGKGVAYGKHAGLCLETQKFPNAINVPSWREQALLPPALTYLHTMVLRFGAE